MGSTAGKFSRTMSRARSWSGLQTRVLASGSRPSASSAGWEAVSRSLTRANCIRLSRSMASRGFCPTSVSCRGMPSCGWSHTGHQ